MVDPTGTRVIDGSLYFAAEPTGVSQDTELWKSDGTAAGTVRVKDIRPGEPSSGPSAITSVNGAIYFRANDGSHGSELFSRNRRW